MAAVDFTTGEPAWSIEGREGFIDALDPFVSPDGIVVATADNVLAMLDILST